MRQVVIPHPGGPEVLAVEEATAPVPAKGEVAIRVRAAGINFADILARQGIYPAVRSYPIVVGYEVAGDVITVGEGVDQSLLGKAVMALMYFGGYAEVVCVDAAHVWEKPAQLSYEEAAAIPENYLTAWVLLVAMGGLSEGDTVLLHNAGGGIGLAAMDIARHRGATIIGTASPRKHEFLKSRGCAHCVDYTREDWPAEILRLTGGKGVELAIDPIGGKNWKKTYSVLGKTGRMGMFGVSAAAVGGFQAKLALVKMVLGMPFFHPLRLMPGNRGVFGVQMHEMYEETDKLRRYMISILCGVTEGWVRPHVDKVFLFSEAAAAHTHIEGRGNIGKVLLVP